MQNFADRQLILARDIIKKFRSNHIPLQRLVDELLAIIESLDLPKDQVIRIKQEWGKLELIYALSLEESDLRISEQNAIDRVKRKLPTFEALLTGMIGH